MNWNEKLLVCKICIQKIQLYRDINENSFRVQPFFFWHIFFQNKQSADRMTSFLAYGMLFSHQILDLKIYWSMPLFSLLLFITTVKKLGAMHIHYTIKANQRCPKWT